MSDELKVDWFGSEVRRAGGRETYALWLPITAAEKEAAVKKAKAEKVDLAEMTADYLRTWLKGGELGSEEMAKVAGGLTPIQMPRTPMPDPARYRR